MRQLKIVKSITNRESASFEKYLQEIGKEEMITSAEEVVLAVQIRAGDKKALDKLTRANLRFVVSVAKQYQNQGLSLPDLINEGNLGLIKAAKKFDETKGFKFISYAVWWIRQSIMQALAEQSRIVRFPLNQLSLSNKVKKASDKFEQKHERLPSNEELSEELGVQVDLIKMIQGVSKKRAYLDAPLVEDEDSTLIDMLEDGDSVIPDAFLNNESKKFQIKRFLKKIRPQEAEVLTLFFGLDGGNPLTLDEIGERTGLTRERCRQQKESGLKRIRQLLRKSDIPLENYLE